MKICPRTRVAVIHQPEQVVPQQLLTFEERGNVVHVRRLEAGQGAVGANEKYNNDQLAKSMQMVSQPRR